MAVITAFHRVTTADESTCVCHRSDILHYPHCLPKRPSREVTLRLLLKVRQRWFSGHRDCTEGTWPVRTELESEAQRAGPGPPCVLSQLEHPVGAEDSSAQE